MSSNTLYQIPIFAPTQISGCSLWLDGADTSAVIRSGSSVTQWNDKSGNSRNFAGGTSPTYVTNGLNGLPVLSFANNFLSNAGFSLYAGASSGAATFVVFNTTNVNQQSQFIEQSNSGGSNNWTEIGFSYASGPSYSSNNYGSIGFHRGNGSVTQTAAGTLSANTNYIYSGLLANAGTTPTSVGLFLNGTQQTSVDFTTGVETGFFSPGSYPTTNTSVITVGCRLITGSSNFYAGTMGEIIMYNSAITSSQRQQVEGYLAWKWGLVGSLPSNHPYKTAPLYSATTLPPQFRGIGTIPLAPSSAPFSFFNPRSIPGCSLWLDPTDSSSFTFSGTTITQWRDKSVNALTGTAQNSPTYTANGLNGYPAITFNGTNQYIDFGNNLNMGTSQIYTFAVSKYDSTADGGLVSKGSTRLNAARWLLQREGGTTMRWGVDVGSGAVLATFTDTSTSPRLLTGYWDRSSVYLRQNGTQQSTAVLNSSANLSNTDPLYVGQFGNATGTGPQAGMYFFGKMGEILVYLSSLSLAQVEQVEGYLAWKWGLVANLPSNHPFKNAPPGLSIPVVPQNRQLANRFWSPTSITGCSLWLDAADPATLSLSGSSVTQWNDKSGNGRNATQGTPSQRPTFASSTVSFNATNSNVLALPDNTIPSGNSAYSSYFVMAPRSTDGVFLFSGNAVNNQANGFFFNLTASHFNNYWLNADIIGGTATNGTRTLLGFVYTQNINRYLYQNGALQITTASSNRASGTGNNYIGAEVVRGFYATCDINEIIIYSTDSTASQRQQIEGYLAWKWGLQGSLPGNHPYKKFPPPPS
jgi:hypothetical protein